MGFCVEHQSDGMESERDDGSGKPATYRLPGAKLTQNRLAIFGGYLQCSVFF